MYRTNTVHSNIGDGTSHPNKVDMCDKLDLVVQPHIWIEEYRGTLCLQLILTENLVVNEIVSYGGMFSVKVNNNLYLFKYEYLSNRLQFFFLFNALVNALYLHMCVATSWCLR